ncbi:MAG TPA: PAS domain-containing protein [Azospirillum sp.]|nr:PAS domain-containing protein [Azospirillum sp.]
MAALEAENAGLRAAIQELSCQSKSIHENAEALEANQADLETVTSLNEDLRRANAELEESRARLEASEQRLRAVLEGTTEYAILTTDAEGAITGWNSGARNILGWDEAEVLGRNVSLIFPPEDRERGVPEAERALALAEGQAPDERWHVRKNASRFWATSTLMQLHDGGAAGFLKVLRDHTWERLAQEAVDAANQRATDTLENISDGFIAMDREYRLTYQNRQAERITRQPLDALRGKSVWELWPAALGTPVEAASRRAMEERIPVELEYRFGDEARHIWLEIRYHPTPEGLASFFRDITPRKRAEEGLRAAHEHVVEILESINDAFYAVDHEWRFTYINRKAEEWWERRREDLLGKVCWEEFPQAIGSEPYEAHLRAAREQHAVRIETMSPILHRWVDVSIYPSGAGLSVYFRDITERKRAEEALHLAKEQAERANVAKSKFLAAASHDLRQPMQSLLLFLDVLKPHVAPKGQEALKHLGRGLDALRDLLDSLLDISRLDAGVVQPTIEGFAVRQVIEQIGAAYAPIAAAKGLDFHVGQCPAVVRSDRTLLGRMVRNLVENALRYTKAGRIAIECHEIEERLRIEVHDTGIGIRPEHLEWIWEEFHQVGNPERDRNRGLGLGLAIVQRLSSLLAHPVRVRSVPGQGSVFTIEVPLGEATPVHVPVSTTETVGNGRFAVLVDDDAIVLLGLKATFESWGYAVLAAASTDQALARLQESGRRPDVIVADYRLREGRFGTETIRRVREAYGPEVPGIILTGETGAEVLQETAAHRLHIIHKPVTPRQLGEALKGLWRQWG